MSLWSRIANVLRGDHLSREIHEEIQSHIQEAIDHGRDPADARQAFGSPLRQLDESHDIRVVAWLDSLRADAIFGWRQLKKNKVTSAAAILSLALAIGSSVSAFRLIDAMLLRPLPVAHAERLFFLTYPYLDAAGQTQTADSFDYPQFRTVRAALKQDAELIAISRPNRNGLTFGSDDETEKVWRQSVSGGMFASFGLKPALGRLLTAEDDVKPGANPVAVLSYDYWSRRFARDPTVIGRKFRMGAVYQIVGVCEKAFTGTEPGTVTDIFVPTMMNAQAIENANWSWFRIWVRLKPGATPEPVLEKLRAAVSAFREERVKTWPPGLPRERIEEYVRAVLFLEPASAGASGLQRDYRSSLVVLAVVVALVLLIACANVANLMTAQAAARSREMALRVSIGAGRSRLVQLVIVESVLIALCASALGGMFAWWSAPSVVSRINPPDNPARLILPADWRVLAFAAGLALAVTLLFGLMPALRASAVKPMSALRGGDDPHSRRRLMNVLVAVQVAFCFLVLFVTGLFVATFDRLAHQPTGFVADRLLALETVTRNNQPSPYWDQVRQHLQSVSGVESVALCGWALMTGNGWSDAVWVNGRPPNNEEAYFLAVSPGWFETMRIPLLDGRDFVPQDTFAGTVIVNQAFARRYFEGRNPVGESLETLVDRKLARSQIVGYARDARYLNMREPIRPTIYVPIDKKSNVTEASPGWATFMVRTTTADPMTLASILRREVPRARPEFLVASFRTQTELVEQHTVRERLLAMLSVFFAVVAVVLAGVGLYGVLTWSVVQRQREIGIRIALGAPPAAVARRLIAGVFSMLLLGAAIGLIAGLASQRYLETLLYQVKPTDPAMLTLPSLTMLVAASLAALPAVVRAVRIDPATTLRSE